MAGKFLLHSKFKPSGDQPQAIEVLSNGVLAGLENQTLIGATGTGKTFTMANVIQNVQKPTLVLSHNKTLSAQLFAEFREFFPENSVQYFVSYYDYYQPEAYVPQRDMYIEKDADINETIERYRSAATQSLLTRPDTIIVGTVSCIYGLGNPEDYQSLSRQFEVGKDYTREQVLIWLRDMQYERVDLDFEPGSYRVRGDIVDINIPSYEDTAVRLEFFGETLDAIKMINSLTGELMEQIESIDIFPAKQFVTPFEALKAAFPKIREDLEKEIRGFKDKGREVEAARLRQRVEYDLEMLEETGYCKGIENYSRYIDGRMPGSAPSCLLDYFPQDYLMIIDESHITVPQVGGMYRGDLSRKQNLVDYGFRLKAAMDNRPLKFEEFQKRTNQVIYTSATPKDYEIEESKRSALLVREKSAEIFVGEEIVT